ncbi:hypothetical protein AAZX31_09G076300 [Glycine max]
MFQMNKNLFGGTWIGLLNGLATSARDMVGLDKSRTPFSSQVFHSLGTQRKITLCLSPTSGIVQLGKVTHESQPESEISRSLTLTGSVIIPSFFSFFAPPCGIMCIQLLKWPMYDNGIFVLKFEIQLLQ